jgi:hypothetical protein
MNLHRMAIKLNTLLKTYELEGIDIMLLSYIVYRIENEPEVSISSAVQNFGLACKSTTHTRYKKLVRLKYLSWEFSKNNESVRRIIKGKDLHKVLNYIKAD